MQALCRSHPTNGQLLPSPAAAIATPAKQLNNSNVAGETSTPDRTATRMKDTENFEHWTRANNTRTNSPLANWGCVFGERCNLPIVIVTTIRTTSGLLTVLIYREKKNKING